jgi:hypothetical protein
MTWLGKILTFVVMLGAVVWAYFTVQSYVTRVNWKNELERERVARKAAQSALTTRNGDLIAENESLKRRAEAAEKLALGYQNQVKDLRDKSNALETKYSDLQTSMGNMDAKMMVRDAKTDRTLKELVTVRDRNNTLENQLVTQALAVEDAKKQELKAKNEAKLALAIADEYSRRFEEQLVKYTALKNSAGSGRDPVLNAIDKPPQPVLPNLRGEVTAVAGDLVTLSIGIDAGLTVGTTLDIYRTEGGARYLGTVKVTSALNLFPKHTIATFIPSRNVPVERLRPEELPKKGDEVRPLSALGGGQ